MGIGATWIAWACMDDRLALGAPRGVCGHCFEGTCMSLKLGNPWLQLAENISVWIHVCILRIVLLVDYDVWIRRHTLR